ncbi:hypothetical protein N0V84_011227 [Fusarium piperis]|uniref:Uncharacterized protein n=1 Tax=Fusarium piperis TaxID=1435070 RepID=A0A9W8W499_9HYPO|nr:hypothetical protein N0V84_011227 [Fusarium piperis]
MIPKTQKQWIIRGSDGFESLEFQKEAPVPSIGDQDVLVQSIIDHSQASFSRRFPQLSRPSDPQGKSYAHYLYFNDGI